ncbi:MAG: hypothetical protein JNJ45_04350 [Chthonomonas sp.]|nr:hypothetical protein [Chthonomonas sp.]
MNYAEALAYVHGLAPRGWRMGLDRMHEFARRASLEVGPERKFLHIAGTNGKGSTTAFVQSLLREHVAREGAFFSPFVYDPRERVQGPDGYIPEADFARIVTELEPLVEELEASEFELKTTIGFKFWAEQHCQAVALEVGLGGRLDATNICVPAATAIVSIGLDHQAILGDTIELIAAEKAGIIKPGVPVVLGSLPEAAERVIRAIADERGAPIVRPEPPAHTPTKLRGSMMPHNFAVALALFGAAGYTADPASVQRAAATATCPGRYEHREINGRLWILDGAHNADSARALAESLAQDGHHDLVLITNVLHGHNPSEVFAALAPFCAEARVVPIDFHRARAVEETAALLREHIPDTVANTTLAAGLEDLPPNCTVLVTGSFYLLGDVHRYLSCRS